jgi:hypothetical protein
MDNHCSVCLDEQTSDKWVETQCNHRFHVPCLQTWLNNYCKTCPMCRTNNPTHHLNFIILFSWHNHHTRAYTKIFYHVMNHDFCDVKQLTKRMLCTLSEKFPLTDDTLHEMSRTKVTIIHDNKKQCEWIGSINVPEIKACLIQSIGKTCNIY